MVKNSPSIEKNKATPINVGNSLVYVNSAKKEHVLASKDGVLEVLIHPTSGDSIICNDEVFVVDKQTGIPPALQMNVVKGQIVELEFRNKSSSSFGKKFKQVWWYSHIKSQEGSNNGSAFSSPTTLPSKKKKKGKGMLHKIKKTISPKKYKDRKKAELVANKKNVPIKNATGNKIAQPEERKSASGWYGKLVVAFIASILCTILAKYMLLEAWLGSANEGQKGIEVAAQI